MNLNYISYSDYKKRGLDLSKIRSFSCGVEEFNHFLQEDIGLWESRLSGVMCLLIYTVAQTARILSHGFEPFRFLQMRHLSIPFIRINKCKTTLMKHISCLRVVQNIQHRSDGF